MIILGCVIEYKSRKAQQELYPVVIQPCRDFTFFIKINNKGGGLYVVQKTVLRESIERQKNYFFLQSSIIEGKSSQNSAVFLEAQHLCNQIDVTDSLPHSLTNFQLFRPYLRCLLIDLDVLYLFATQNLMGKLLMLFSWHISVFLGIFKF